MAAVPHPEVEIVGLSDEDGVALVVRDRLGDEKTSPAFATSSFFTMMSGLSPSSPPCLVAVLVVLLRM